MRSGFPSVPGKPKPVDVADVAAIRRYVTRIACGYASRSGLDVADVTSRIMLRMPVMDAIPDRMWSWGFVAASARNALASIVRDDHALKRGHHMHRVPLAADLLERKRDIGEQERCELRLDIETCLAKESADVRRLCVLLATHSVTDAARAMGIPRSTAAGWIASLRERMEARGMDASG